MQRIAAFVDAGYFWVQCSNILFQEKKEREEIILDPITMRKELLNVINKEFGIDSSNFLRVYWYDGLDRNGNPSQINIEISLLDDIKMRYGTINSHNQQKGVDGLIIADLINLAQNKAITSALLISGDADLAPGVVAAQMLGIRVHRLEMYSSEASSYVLKSEADRNILWDTDIIKTFIKPKIDEVKEDNMIGINKELLHQIALKFIQSLSEKEKPTNFRFEKYFDVNLIKFAKEKLQRYLDKEEINQLRDFVRQELGLIKK